MRARVGVVATVVASGVAAGLAMAQQQPVVVPAPTVVVTATSRAVSVGAPGALPAGPTRFDFVRPAGTKDLSVYVALLVPGVSLEQLQQTIARDDRTHGDSALGLVSIQASASLSGRETHRAVTFNVKPAVTYVVLAEQDANTSGPPPRAFTTFASSGDANGATAPAPAATIRMQGLRFRGSAVLPRNGIVRVRNQDGVAHFALAFPLRKGTTKAQLGRAVRAGQRAFGRVVAGAPYGVQNVISGGDTSNDQELHFPRKGRYGLVCFIYEHHRLGMYRVVSVK
jgi:hypothetical protein